MDTESSKSFSCRFVSGTDKKEMRALGHARLKPHRGNRRREKQQTRTHTQGMRLGTQDSLNYLGVSTSILWYRLELGLAQVIRCGRSTPGLLRTLSEPRTPALLRCGRTTRPTRGVTCEA